jgi:hypothetical protein
VAILVDNAGLETIHETDDQATSSCDDINPFVIEVARMNEYLALAEDDRLSKAAKVGPSADVLGSIGKHQIPRYV